jgi:hypothetical protein
MTGLKTGPSACLYVCLPELFYVSLSLCLSVHLLYISAYLTVRLYVCQPIYTPPVCLSVFACTNVPKECNRICRYKTSKQKNVGISYSLQKIFLLSDYQSRNQTINFRLPGLSITDFGYQTVGLK